MKNLLKYISLAAFVAVSMTACSEDGPDYDAAPAQYAGDMVYFDSETPVSLVLGLEDKSFEFTLLRDNAAGSCSVSLKGSTDYLTVPATATFKEGEKSTTVVVTLSDKVKPFVNYSLIVEVVGDYANNYQQKIDKFSRNYFTVLQEDYQKYSDGEFQSQFFGETFDAILEYSPLKDCYRLSDLYFEGYGIEFTWDKETNKLEWAKQPTGYIHSVYGMVSWTPNDEVESFYSEKSKAFVFYADFTVSAGSFGVKQEVFLIK